jgi:hypothetical protein
MKGAQRETKTIKAKPKPCPCGCGAVTGGRWRLRCLHRIKAAARPKWRGTFREAAKARRA